MAKKQTPTVQDYHKSETYKNADAETRRNLHRYKSELNITDEQMNWLMALEDVRLTPKEQRRNRAGNRPSEADESVPVYAAVRAGQLQTGRTRTIPPQRAQFVDLCRGWFVDVLQNESYRPHRAELSHRG